MSPISIDNPAAVADLENVGAKLQLFIYLIFLFVCVKAFPVYSIILYIDYYIFTFTHTVVSSVLRCNQTAQFAAMKINQSVTNV